MRKRWFPPLDHMQAANAVTTLGIIFSVTAILLVFRHEVRIALLLSGLAVLSDRLDGVVARKLSLHSPFGEQLDSLGDAIGFCLFPALAAYGLGFATGWAIPILVFYPVAGLWRLGHFNLTGLTEREGRAYFAGVPTTVVAAWFLILSPVLMRLRGTASEVVFAAFFIGTALLMLSSLPYPKGGISSKAMYVLVPAAILADLFWT